MPPRKGVGIKLGDRTKSRRLRFDQAALERLQEETASKQWLDGMPLTAYMQSLAAINVKSITTGVWVGLLHEEPRLTRAQVRDLIDPKRISEMMEAIADAIAQALPDSGTEEADGAEGKADAES